MLEGREYDAWSDFITSIGKDTARAFLNARGYRKVSDINPARRQSVMKGMACDVRDGFKHSPFGIDTARVVCVWWWFSTDGWKT